MEIKPRGDWLVMRPFEAPVKWANGLEIPEGARNNMAARPLGIVESKGPDVPDEVKVGSVVLFNENKWQAVPGLDTRVLRMAQWGTCIGLVTSDMVATSEQLARANKARQQEQEAAAAQERVASLQIANGVAGRIG